MAAEGIRISVTDEAILATLERIDQVAAAPRSVMEALSAAMVSQMQTHIQREEGPEGKWPALSPRTANARSGRSRRRGAANMLRVSGRLYQSITGEASDRETRVGTNVVYAAIHQFGGTVTMPAREQEIHLAIGNRGKRFVKASARRKETRRVNIGAHTVTIPARAYLYLGDEDRAELVAEAERVFAQEAGLA